MLGFTPFKKHANKFNYIPRYYDPVKEAREERRAELRGERSEDAGREYRPGQYIRTQHAARAARRSREDNAGNMRIWKLAAVAVVATVFIYLLYPRPLSSWGWVRPPRRPKPPPRSARRRATGSTSRMSAMRSGRSSPS